MFDYTKLSYQLKREIKIFANKISKGLSKPKYKFVFQMLYGILESQSTHLSNISRALKEETTLKKTIDRLSRNLNRFTDNDLLIENYMKIVKKYTSKLSVLIIDNGDISKPNGKVFDSLCKVRDGSTGKCVSGYHLLEISALTKNEKMPMPVYSHVYSSTDKDFMSEDNEVLKGLKHLTKHFSKNGIRTMDRGYDANAYYRYFLKECEPFIIRAKKNRDVIFNGNKENILSVTKRFKGKYSLSFKNKAGKRVECKIAFIPICLPMSPDKELNLIVVYGFSETPLMLISNVKSKDKRLPVIITKVYLMRWRIEEYYRFKKQQFNFEDFRVQSLTSIRGLNTILTLLIGLLATFSEKQDTSQLIFKVIKCSRRIYGKAKFIYYALGIGIFNILRKTKDGIYSFLNVKKIPSSQQLDIFKFFNIKEHEFLDY
jgi:hypothetical protein